MSTLRLSNNKGKVALQTVWKCLSSKFVFTCLSAPQDPIALWPVRSLWTPFSLSECLREVTFQLSSASLELSFPILVLKELSRICTIQSKSRSLIALLTIKKNSNTTSSNWWRWITSLTSKSNIKICIDFTFINKQLAYVFLINYLTNRIFSDIQFQIMISWKI